MPGAEEYLVDVYASLRSNEATGATRAMIPHICGVVCRLDSSNDISKLIIDSAIDGERADWGQGEESVVSEHDEWRIVGVTVL